MSKELGEQGAQGAVPQPLPQPIPNAINGDEQSRAADAGQPPSKEIGGPSGPDPTRYGDWERRGRCIDF